MKIFDTRIFWNTEGVSYEVFRYCETKNFDTKLWYPLHAKNFFDNRNFLMDWIVPTKFFGTVRQKFWKVVIPPLFHKNIEVIGGIDICRKPSKTRFQTVVSFWTICKCWSKYLHSGEKGFPCEIFRRCGTRSFRRKILIIPPTLSSKPFRYPKLMKD